MNKHRSCSLITGLLAFILVLGFVGAFVACTKPEDVAQIQSGRFSEYVDDKGNISLPNDYRTKFSHLGTFSVASKSGGHTDELHNVYTREEDVAAFQRDGKFPDGAVIVKEVYATEMEVLTTGDSSWATDTKVWFVMIKDSVGRFKENKLWGEGWGWALFEGKDPKKQVATNYGVDCRTCHVPAQKDDWIYLRGYPTLRQFTKK
jgi:hypothetical protein